MKSGSFHAFHCCKNFFTAFVEKEKDKILTACFLLVSLSLQEIEFQSDLQFYSECLAC